MASQNYNTTHLEHNLKRSFMLQPFGNSNIPNQIIPNRSSSKRTSLTLVQNQHNPSFDHSKTPKANPTNMIPNLNNFSMAGHYFHQSSYVNHSYQIPPPPSSQINTSRAESLTNRSQISSSRAEVVANKIQPFTLQQKKRESIQQMIRQLNQKVQKITKKVQKHQVIVRNSQNINKPNNSQNEPPLNNQFLVKIIQETINDYNKARQIEVSMHQKMLKSQIDALKQHISNFATTRDVDDRFRKIGFSINKQIQNTNRQLKDSISNLIQNQKKDRRIDMERLKTDFQQQFIFLNKNIEQKVRIIKEKIESDKKLAQIGPNSSKKLFIGDPLLVKFATKVSIITKSNTKQIEDSETVYKLDNQGYLLDSQGRYIINSNYEQVKLSQQQLKIIKQKGFLI